jgi:Glyoxalase-like domain
VPEPIARTIDHVVHAVEDLDAAAGAYRQLGFVVTPRADHPFGTSNRLVVLGGSYLELVAVTAPERIPITGFAARVASHLLTRGPGISHVVLSSGDPQADRALLGELSTGEVFSFSRPAPQPEGPAITAAFDCVLIHAPADLGMFLCHHRVPQAVWNRTTTNHPNRATTITGLDLPVEPDSLRVLARVAGAPTDSGRLGPTAVGVGPATIRFDVAVDATLIAGVSVGGVAAGTP